MADQPLLRPAEGFGLRRPGMLDGGAFLGSLYLAGAAAVRADLYAMYSKLSQAPPGVAALLERLAPGLVGM